MVASYCTLAELKSALGGVAGAGQDADLQLAVDTASRTIEDHCRRHFWSATLTRTYTPDTWQYVTIDDLASITTLRTDDNWDGVYETTWQASEFQLAPVNAATWSEAKPYTRINAVGGRWLPAPFYEYQSPYQYRSLVRRNLVEVTGTFGWQAVPVAVKRAALILAVDTYKLKDAPFGVQAYGDYGVRVKDNPRATALLLPYRRDPVLVA